jgi:hypothetical protein
MFHITVLCERLAERAMTRVPEPRFGAHFVAGKSIVNSPLHCWTLDGERERLWKSLSAPLSTLFTVARRACAITGSQLIRFVENILLSRARYGVDVPFSGLSGPPVWEFVPFTLSRRLDAFCSSREVTDLKNLEKEF